MLSLRFEINYPLLPAQVSSAGALWRVLNFALRVCQLAIKYGLHLRGDLLYRQYLASW